MYDTTSIPGPLGQVSLIGPFQTFSGKAVTKSVKRGRRVHTLEQSKAEDSAAAAGVGCGAAAAAEGAAAPGQGPGLKWKLSDLSLQP